MRRWEIQPYDIVWVRYENRWVGEVHHINDNAFHIRDIYTKRVYVVYGQENLVRLIQSFAGLVDRGRR